MGLQCELEPVLWGEDTHTNQCPALPAANSRDKGLGLVVFFCAVRKENRILLRLQHCSQLSCQEQELPLSRRMQMLQKMSKGSAERIDLIVVAFFVVQQTNSCSYFPLKVRCA